MTTKQTILKCANPTCNFQQVWYDDDFRPKVCPFCNEPTVTYEQEDKPESGAIWLARQGSRGFTAT